MPAGLRAAAPRSTGHAGGGPPGSPGRGAPSATLSSEAAPPCVTTKGPQCASTITAGASASRSHRAGNRRAVAEGEVHFTGKGGSGSASQRAPTTERTRAGPLHWVGVRARKGRPGRVAGAAPPGALRTREALHWKGEAGAAAAAATEPEPVVAAAAAAPSAPPAETAAVAALLAVAADALPAKGGVGGGGASPRRKPCSQFWRLVVRAACVMCVCVCEEREREGEGGRRARACV